ncbi:SulP family inorganic anion transporter [Amycolatopsis sp. NPDC051372]|uniref:SulP family inorganic anion transporter n=1 Tax=Amycolatopsis sp. NPDC051372 TaxID=3155669 RepID=UPI00341C709B
MVQWIPGLRVVRTYRRQWLVKDVVAGVVLTTLLVPQGMAYAELAGLPAITGLYTSILCLLGYAVFGPSRILVLGPDSSLGPMIAATILPLVAAEGDPARAVALASMLAIMVAVIMIVASVAKLGFIADLISKPTMIGYLNGLALTIVVGQLPKLCGFSVDAEGLIAEIGAVARQIAGGEVVGAAAAVGLGALAVILVLQRWVRKVPAVLVVVVLALIAVPLLDLAEHGVQVVGVLPAGFPPLTFPHVGLADLAPLLAGAVGIAVVSLADTISTASAFAARTGQEVHGNPAPRRAGRTPARRGRGPTRHPAHPARDAPGPAPRSRPSGLHPPSGHRVNRGTKTDQACGPHPSCDTAGFPVASS